MGILIETADVDYEVRTKAQDMTDEIVNQLVKKRKELNLSQQDIADMAGMPRANISRMERKLHPPTVALLIRYARCLNMELKIALVDKDSSK